MNSSFVPSTSSPIHSAATTRTGWRGPIVVAVLAILLTITLVGTASAAITRVASATGHTGVNGAQSIVITAPAASAGDLIVAHVAVESFNTSDGICPTTGWTSVLRTNNSSSVAQQIFYRVAGGGEGSPTPYTWQFRTSLTCGGSLVSSNKGAVGGITVYSGVDVTPPTDAILGFLGATGSNNTVNAPSIAGPFPAGSRVVRFFGNGKEFVLSTAGSGSTPVYSVNRPKSGGGFEKPSGAAADADQAAAGATGTVTGSNGGQGGNWVAQTVVLKMAVGNTAPTLTNVPTAATICELVEYTFDANGSDSDVPAQTLTFSLQGTVPTGVTFSASTGVLSWTPAENQDGVHTFKVRVTDNGVPPLFTEQTVTLTVLEANVAPVLDPIGNQTVIIGDLLTFTATGSDSDLVGGVPNTLTFSLEGTVPAGASIDPSTGVFTWTPVIGQDGEHMITVRATDDGPGNACGTASLFDEETITITVRRQTFFLVLDSDAISPDQEPNDFTQDDVNEGIAGIGQRMQLAWFADPANQSTTIDLPSGQVGDEGWFALKAILASWDAAGPTADGLRNLLLAGPGLGSGGDPEALLDGISDVTPLRFTGLGVLVGHQVCAVVWKSDISIGYDPLTGNLKGDNRGVVAFEVDGVTPVGEGSMLPLVTVKVRDAGEVCAEPLRLLTDAPEPISSSDPPDVGP